MNLRELVRRLEKIEDKLRKNNDEDTLEMINKLIEDFDYIKHEIRRRYNKKIELSTINGPNDIIQIRTKASKPYTAMKYKGFQLYDKYMAFYYKANYVKELAKS